MALCETRRLLLMGRTEGRMITDELRQLIPINGIVYIYPADLKELADRIDEQHQRDLSAAYQRGYEDAEEAATWRDGR